MVKLKRGRGINASTPTPHLFFSIKLAEKRPSLLWSVFLFFRPLPRPKKSTPPILPRTGKPRGEQKANLTEVEREPYWGRGGGKSTESPEKDTTTRRGRGQPQQPNKKKHQKKKRKKNNNKKNNFKNNFSNKNIFMV